MTTLEFHRGYFRGLLDAYNLIELINRHEFIKASEKAKVMQAALNDVLVNKKIDYFMDYGGQVEFKYKYEKGKVTFIDVGESKK